MTLANKPVLLVAEDDPDDQWLIQDAFDGACPHDGAEIRFVDDGVELMTYLHQDGQYKPRPQLIVLDLNMPRKDGRAALREIRNEPGLAAIPVVVLTTSQADEDSLYCRRVGVQGYYRKPGSQTELENIFNRLCEEYLQ